MMLLSVMAASAQNSGEEIERGGRFDSWRVRKIKESGIIGGNWRMLYEIAPQGDTLIGAVAYKRPAGWVWRTSNVLAIVSGVTKASGTVTPERRGSGWCAKLETKVERVKAMGIINRNVLVSGTVFLGEMHEPIKDTKNPRSKQNSGIPYTERPSALSFDYKVTVGDKRVYANGSKIKEIGDADYAECMLLLQKRTEDAEGNVTALRVGTLFKRFSKADSKKEWTNGYTLPVLYGDITSRPEYRSYMGLIPEEESHYTVNSKGVSVPVVEKGWAAENETPTHIILVFSSSYGTNYTGDPSNCLWIDNVKLVK